MKDKNIVINIPNPCSYGWDKMTVTDDSKGRHCKACDKVVVDFTTMTTEQIISFLDKHKGSRVCGHFKTADTTAAHWYHRPFLKLHGRIERNYKKNLMHMAGLFLVGSILALTGCRDRDRCTEGEYINAEDTLMQVDTIIPIDSTKNAELDNDSSSTTLQSQ